MRSFPRTASRRLRMGAVTAASALLLGALTMPVVAPLSARASDLKGQAAQR
ncbi:MAG: hypothetical protein R2734_08335 [Nocardioides sp.]